MIMVLLWLSKNLDGRAFSAAGMTLAFRRLDRDALYTQTGPLERGRHAPSNVADAHPQAQTPGTDVTLPWTARISLSLLPFSITEA